MSKLDLQLDKVESMFMKTVRGSDNNWISIEIYSEEKLVAEITLWPSNKKSIDFVLGEPE